MPTQKPNTPSPCEKATKTIQAIRVAHPNLPDELLGFIWGEISQGKCGPLPPPA